MTRVVIIAAPHKGESQEKRTQRHQRSHHPTSPLGSCSECATAYPCVPRSPDEACRCRRRRQVPSSRARTGGIGTLGLRRLHLLQPRGRWPVGPATPCGAGAIGQAVAAPARAARVPRLERSWCLTGTVVDDLRARTRAPRATHLGTQRRRTRLPRRLRPPARSWSHRGLVHQLSDLRGRGTRHPGRSWPSCSTASTAESPRRLSPGRPEAPGASGLRFEPSRSRRRRGRAGTSGLRRAGW